MYNHDFKIFTQLFNVPGTWRVLRRVPRCPVRALGWCGWLLKEEETMIAPVKAASQYSAAPAPPRSAVSASEVDSSRIYGSSYSGVSFGSSFSPDNLLLTDRRPVRSRSALSLCRHNRLCLVFSSCHSFSSDTFFCHVIALFSALSYRLVIHHSISIAFYWQQAVFTVFRFHLWHTQG